MAVVHPVTDLPQADYAELRAALLGWRDAGQANPLIPLDYDVDGDGTTDAYGLDDLGRLVYVSGADLDETVAEATGNGTEDLHG